MRRRKRWKNGGKDGEVEKKDGGVGKGQENKRKIENRETTNRRIIERK